MRPTHTKNTKNDDGSNLDARTSLPDDDEKRRQNEELRDRLKRLERVVTPNRSGDA